LQTAHGPTVTLGEVMGKGMSTALLIATVRAAADPGESAPDDLTVTVIRDTDVRGALT
jgi:hypothetical protein